MSSSHSKQQSYLDQLNKFLNETDGALFYEPDNNEDGGSSLSNVIADCYAKLKNCNSSCKLEEADTNRLRALQNVIEGLLSEASKQNEHKFTGNANRRNDRYQNPGNFVKNQNTSNTKNRFVDKRGGKRFDSNMSLNDLTNEVACPCCCAPTSGVKELFYHLEDACEAYRSGVVTRARGFSLFQIVSGGLKCNPCGTILTSYDQKHEHENSLTHLDARAKQARDNILENVFHCASCHEAVPACEAHYQLHLKSRVHSITSGINRTALISSNIAFHMHAEEVKCVLCNKWMNFNGIKIHTGDVNHDRKMANNPQCLQLYCLLCKEYMAPFSASIHARMDNHKKHSECVCVFCETNPNGEIINHLKYDCTVIKDLIQRRANITRNRARSTERRHSRPNQPQPRKNFEPPPITSETVFITGLANVSRIEFTMNLMEAYEGHVDEVIPVDNDTLKVIFKTVDAAKALAMNPEIDGVRVKVTSAGSSE